LRIKSVKESLLSGHKKENGRDHSENSKVILMFAGVVEIIVRSCVCWETTELVSVATSLYLISKKNPIPESIV
jgi:hypothetical protein